MQRQLEDKDIQRINNLLEQGNHSRTDVTYVFGNTGQGKSTIINCLIGNQIAVQRKGNRYHSFPQTYGQKYPSIGNQVVSETQNPAFYKSKTQDKWYGDFPGFKDTKGTIQELINACSISIHFKKGTKVKFLLLLSEDTLINARGQDFIEFIRRFLDYFPKDQKRLAFSTVLLISKVSRDEDKKEDIISSIEEIIDQQNNPLNTSDVKMFLRLLIINQNISLFYKPTENTFKEENIQQIHENLNYLSATTLQEDANISMSTQIMNLVKASQLNQQKILKHEIKKIPTLIRKSLGSLSKKKQIQDCLARLKILSAYFIGKPKISYSSFKYIMNMLDIKVDFIVKQSCKQCFSTLKTLKAIIPAFNPSKDVFQPLQTTVRELKFSLQKKKNDIEHEIFMEIRKKQMKIVQDHEKRVQKKKITQLEKKINFQSFVHKATLDRSRETGSYQLNQMAREQERKVQQLRNVLSRYQSMI